MLLDTNVISELQKPSGDPKVKMIAAKWEPELRLSVVVLGEVVFGLERLPQGRRREELLLHYIRLKQQFADRILDVTNEVSERWGRLSAEMQRAGRAIHVADGLIAATALHHDMGVMTRNTRDFELTGVRLINPWED